MRKKIRQTAYYKYIILTLLINIFLGFIKIQLLKKKLKLSSSFNLFIFVKLKC